MRKPSITQAPRYSNPFPFVFPNFFLRAHLNHWSKAVARKGFCQSAAIMSKRIDYIGGCEDREREAGRLARDQRVSFLARYRIFSFLRFPLMFLFLFSYQLVIFLLPFFLRRHHLLRISLVLFPCVAPAVVVSSAVAAIGPVTSGISPTVSLLIKCRSELNPNFFHHYYNLPSSMSSLYIYIEKTRMIKSSHHHCFMNRHRAYQ